MKYIKYNHQDSNDAILLLHGGTFVNGDETYNKDQAEYFSKSLKINVYTLGFSTENLYNSKKDIIEFYNFISNIHENIIIIGTSSGGYLALECYNELNKKPSKIYLICPPLDPDARSLNNPLIKDMQQKYFKGSSPKAKIIRNFITFIFAKNDNNVPLNTVHYYAQKYPRKHIHILEGNHDISFKINEDVLKCLDI